MNFLRLLPCLFALAAIARAQTTPAARAPDLANNPAAATAAINPALPTIFIAGDSTAARSNGGERQQGWGLPFADYFDATKVNIVNRARGGRSSRTFIAEGSWDAVVADLKKDDIVLIQFGHNDGSPVNEAESIPAAARRARGSIPGLGEDTQEIDNIITKKHEVVHTFGWYMRKMIADTVAKGAKPIVISLTARNVWKDGKIERGSGEYSPWSKEIATKANVPFVDLTMLMADKFEAMGVEKTKEIYQQDHTHFNAIGADLHAATVVAGLKTLHPSPVAKLLSAKGEAVPAVPAPALAR